MTLNKRITLLFALSYVVLLGGTYWYTSVKVQNEVEEGLSLQYGDYLFDISKELEGFFTEIEDDLMTFAENPLVAETKGENFTNFLDADPSTFVYRYSAEEKKIIQHFATFRKNHSSVNSIYLGLADGSFVRSHPRTSPTRYDPRTRPWYLRAIEQPGKTIRTEAYSSVTNGDVNIATVKALQDENGAVFGVIGIDVTLEKLSSRLGAKLLSHDGRLELWNSAGTVLVSFNPLRVGVSGEDATWAREKRVGNCIMDSSPKGYRFRYRLTVPDGTLVAFVPRAGVKKSIGSLINARFVLSTAFLLAIYAMVILMLRLYLFVPLREMSDFLMQSAKDGTPGRMYVRSSGELVEFQKHYNQLVDLAERESIELKKTKFLVISSLASLARKRDNETGLHIIRTQKYMDVLSGAWNQLYPDAQIGASRVSLMVQCAPLHDIGKVAIPDCILLKPGELSDSEFEVMKKHTTYGKEAIEKANVDIEDHDFMSIALAIVHLHHERWDGMGYPLRLQGEAIPIEARFMAIADVYDALTTMRVYKHAYPHDLAVSIIREGCGSQFDPRVVEAFLSVEQRFHEISVMYHEAAHSTPVDSSAL